VNTPFLYIIISSFKDSFKLSSTTSSAASFSFSFSPALITFFLIALSAIALPPLAIQSVGDIIVARAAQSLPSNLFGISIIIAAIISKITVSAGQATATTKNTILTIHKKVSGFSFNSGV
jgi:hypothetical protein